MIFVLLPIHKEIGGYMGFDLNNLNQFPYPSSRRYCSARAAFFDLLQNLDIESIWMPKYICDTMIKPLHMLKINIKFYDLDINFYPNIPIKLEDKDYLLYVNYFGLCTENQQQIVSLYPREKIIFDHSQAFFVKPFLGTHTIYSPRKFFAVADGGLLITAQYMDEVQNQKSEDELIQQYKHLFIRCINGAEQGYPQFQRAEDILSDCIPKKISPITDLILQNIDYAEIKEKRLNNFKYLHSKLAEVNQLKINLDELESPLTYPFLSKENFSKHLISHKVFVPTYWNDCLVRINEDSSEYQFVNKITHFVCDHRYDVEDMQFQIDVIGNMVL